MTNKEIIISGVITGVTLIIIVLIVTSYSSNPIYEDIEYLEPIVNEQTIERERQRNIDSCLQSAFKGYTDDWNGKCRIMGRGDGCSLYTEEMTVVELRYISAKDLCLERYR